jgi:outer membrane receptor protein involved in Fe transport
MKRLYVVLLVVTLLAFTSSSSLAQSTQGAITGTVQDAVGAVLPDAEVTLYSPSTGVTSILKTNKAGIYRFDAVLVGDYIVSVTVPGFAKRESVATVTVGALVGRDFNLSVGSTSSTVEVSSTKSLELQTEDVVRSSTISSIALAELPISGQNSLLLILTAPGVVRSNLGGSSDAGIGSVNGARARSNNFLIDGLQNNDISVTGPQFTITNNDELQEVNFQTSNFTAEYGRAGGAVVSQITKSGTNSIHGTLAEVYRSQVMNASTNTQRINFSNGNAPVVKNVFHENIPAVTIGGPVIIPHLYNGRDKTFFFGAGQWDRFQSNASGSAYIIPTATGYASLQAMAPACPNVATYLALLGTARGSSGTGSSTIPVDLPAGLASTSCFGGARTGQTIGFGQYVRTVPEIIADNNYLARIDHHVSQKQNMMFRFLWDSSNDNIGGTVGIDSRFDIPFKARTFGVNFNHIYALRNNLVNEFRFGFSRANIGYFLPDPTGIASTTPDIGFSGATNLALSAVFPQGRISNNWQFQEAMTFTRGRHAFRGGVDILRQLATQVAPFNGRGQVNYSLTALNAGVGVTSPITELANFMDNYGGTATGPIAKVFGSGRYHPNLFTVAGYLQDTYKATPDLTLTYGLRYENFGQPANIFKSPAFTGYTDADTFSTARVSQDNNNFGPSVGFAYNPHLRDHGFLSGSLVIRAGYQVTYDSFFNNLLSNMAAASPNALSNTPVPSSSTIATPRGTQNLSAVLPTLVPVPLTPYSTIASNFRKGIRNPYYHHFSLGVQQQLPSHIVLDVAYVGSLGRQLFYTNPLNPSLPNLTTLTSAATQTVTINGVPTVTTLRLFPNRGTIQIRDSGLTSNYHSLQVQLRRTAVNTFAGKLTFQTSYTWSKSLDVLSEVFGTNSSPQNPSRSPAFGVPLGYLDYGPSDSDRRHVSSTIVQLQARGVKNRLLNEVVGGWTFAPILTVQSGTPYTVTNGFDRGLDGSTAFSRPNIGNVHAPVNTRGQVVSAAVCSTGLQNPAIGTAAGAGCVTANDVHFVQVASYSPSSPNMESRNSNYTTRYLDLDANVLKNFKITERFGFELRGEFFNITNNQNFDTPAGGTGGTNRNVSAKTGKNFVNFDILNGGSRTMRVGGKVSF